MPSATAAVFHAQEYGDVAVVHTVVQVVAPTSRCSIVTSRTPVSPSEALAARVTVSIAGEAGATMVTVGGVQSAAALTVALLDVVVV